MSVGSHIVPAGVVLKCYMWPCGVCSDNRQLLYVGTQRQPCGLTHTVPKPAWTLITVCNRVPHNMVPKGLATRWAQVPPTQNISMLFTSYQNQQWFPHDQVNQLSPQRTLVSYTYTIRLYSVTYTAHRPPIWSQSTKGRTWRCDGRHEGMISGYSSCEVWRKQYQRTPQILRSNTTTVQQQSKNINMHVCMYVCM